MSMLSVTGKTIDEDSTFGTTGEKSVPLIPVRRANLNPSSAATQSSVYITLKLQNVKSTTVPVKGPQPNWEQDFLL